MSVHTVLLKIRDTVPISRLLLGINWVLIVLFIWMAGGLGARIIENELLTLPYKKPRFVSTHKHVTDKSSPFSRFQPIIDLNVFDAEVKNEEENIEIQKEAEVIPGAKLNEILANLELMGINYSKGRYIFCILKNKKTNVEDIFTIGDEVFDEGVTVKRIYTTFGNQQVHLSLGTEVGILYYHEREPVDLPQKIASGKKVEKHKPQKPSEPIHSKYSTDGKNFYISGTEVDAHLNNFGNLLNQARMVPYFKGGKHQGFKVKAIDKGSLYEKLGLKNNDVIKTINGESLAEAGGEKLMGLFNLLRTEREFTVEIERGGVPQLLSYHIN